MTKRTAPRSTDAAIAPAVRRAHTSGSRSAVPGADEVRDDDPDDERGLDPLAKADEETGDQASLLWRGGTVRPRGTRPAGNHTQLVRYREPGIVGGPGGRVAVRPAVCSAGYHLYCYATRLSGGEDIEAATGDKSAVPASTGGCGTGSRGPACARDAPPIVPHEPAGR